MAIKSILVALSYTDEDKAVITRAVSIADELNAKLHAIHVNNAHAGKVSAMMDALPYIGEDEIRDQVAKYSSGKIAKKLNIIIRQGAYYPEIIATEAAAFDLLIIGHKRKSSILAALTDSTDERVADLSSSLLLLVPLD